MKKFSKRTAIILSAILSVLLIVGLIFSFVPMRFGDKTFMSFSKSINISSDIVGGIYGEFDISTENVSRDDIERSKTIIRNVLSEKGYKNANVYDISGKRIRVELSYPKGSTEYGDVTSSLKLLANGSFELLSASSKDSSDIIVKGCDAVKNVEIKTSNSDTVAISINFSKDGEEQFKNLCNQVSGGQIYLALGSATPSQISVSTAISQGEYSKLELSGPAFSAMVDLKQQIEVGCMPIEFNSKTISIDTMSASLTAGEGASSPENAKFFSSSTYVILIASFVFVAVLILTIFAINFGFYAILVLISMAINTVLFLIIICLIPSVEIGLSGFITLIVGISLIYAYSFDYVFGIKKEYNNGKSISAALESAYKTRMSQTLITTIILFLASLTLVLLSFGELSSVALIFTVLAFLALITNIFVIPFLIKLAISLVKSSNKIFMFKKKSISELDLDNSEEKEAK